MIAWWFKITNPSIAFHNVALEEYLVYVRQTLLLIRYSTLLSPMFHETPKPYSTDDP